jgi:hypothetical protein
MSEDNRAIDHRDDTHSQTPTMRRSLRCCNQNAMFRIRLCSACRSHLSRAEFIHQGATDRRTITFAESGNGVGPAQKEKESNMLKKLLGVAAVAAVAYAFAPAQAAHMGGACSSANLAKTESAIETMADGEHKMAAQKEIAAAQDAMLNGKGSCAAHLSKAMHETAAK